MTKIEKLWDDFDRPAKSYRSPLDTIRIRLTERFRRAREGVINLAEKTGTGLPKNTAAALAYVLGWLTGIVFLLVEKDPFVRFHAMQSIITFGALTILMFIPVIGWILSPLAWIVGFVLWLVLIFKAYQGEEFELPVVGEFAKRQLKKIK